MKSKVPESSTSSKRGQDNPAQVARAYKIHQYCMAQQNDKNPNRKWVPIATLMEDFEVKEDTVRRCIAMMKDHLHLPIEYVPERGGYGYTERVTSFPLMMLSATEVAVLAFAQQLMKTCEGTELYAEMEKILKKALTHLDAGFTEVFDKASAAISFHTIGFAAPANPEPKLFGRVLRSVMDSAELKVEYLAPKVGAQPKTMVIRPLHLSNINHAWYVWHETKNPDKPMKIALTRIKSATRTVRLFTPKKRFDINHELRSALGAFNNEDLEDVAVRFAAEAAPYILERAWTDSRSMSKNPDGSLMMRFTAPLSPELDNLLLPWAGKMEVLEPASLRDAMVKYGKALMDSHAAIPGVAAPQCSSAIGSPCVL